MDDRVMALKVMPPHPVSKKIKFPHVTVAVNEEAGGKPFHSNQLDDSLFTPIDITLHGEVKEIAFAQNPPRKPTVSFSKSPRKEKKMVAVFTYNDGRTKTTHFGAKGMSDYTIHKDPERKKRYITRHRKRENWDDYTSAGSLSRYILWGEPTLRASKDAYQTVQFERSKNQTA